MILLVYLTIWSPVLLFILMNEQEYRAEPDPEILTTGTGNGTSCQNSLAGHQIAFPVLYTILLKKVDSGTQSVLPHIAH